MSKNNIFLYMKDKVIVDRIILQIYYHNYAIFNKTVILFIYLLLYRFIYYVYQY